MGMGYAPGILFIVSCFYQPLYEIAVLVAIIELCLIIGFAMFVPIYAIIGAKRNI